MAEFLVAHDYAVPPGQVFRVATSNDYLQARLQRFGGAGEPNVDDAGSTLRVEIPRQLPMDKVPSAARRFLPGDGKLLQVDEWIDISDGACHGKWHITMHGTPARINGRHAIVGIGEGARYEVHGDVRVSVPMLGGKIAKEVVGYLERLVELELAQLAEFAAS